MVAGNVIGLANQPVTAREIVQKYKELVHDKIISQIVWSGDNRPQIQGVDAVEIALGGLAYLESIETINLGPRQSISFIAVAGGGGGGHGRKDPGGPTGDKKGYDGTNTTFEIRAGSETGTLIKSYDLAGGTGGASAAVSYSKGGYKPAAHGGNVISSDPDYGQIGTGGSPKAKRGATAASGYGAGGGGSWGDLPSFGDRSGRGGAGGKAGELVEETVDTSAYSSENIFLVIKQIGSGGKGGVGGRNSAGNGSDGRSGVIILKEENPPSLTSGGPSFNEDGLIDSILGEDHLGLGRKIDGDKIYEVFLQKTNEYTQIRKLQVIGTSYEGYPADETEVAFLNTNFRVSIDTSGIDIVNSENELDPGDLNEDEDIVTYFNALYDAWAAVRDVPIVNGSPLLTAGVLPTFNSSTGVFSNSIKNTTVYTSSQKFAPTELETIAFIAIGGGGGDGGDHIATGASGGGGGGIAMKILRVSPGATYTLTVGKGGSGSDNGNNTLVTGGGLTLMGGGGGTATDTHGAGNAATNGGQASGGDYNFEGGAGAVFTSGNVTSGGAAGGPTGSTNASDIVLSDWFSVFTKDNGQTIAGSGAAPGSSGFNFGGGAGARPSGGSTKSGSAGCIAIIRFD